MNLSKWINRIFFLFLAYLVVFPASMYTYFYFQYSFLMGVICVAVQVGLLYGIYKWSQKYGVVKKKQSREDVNRLAEKNARREGYKTTRKEMIAQQAEMERAEVHRKQSNPVVDFVDVLKRPGKHSAVQKYRVGFVVEGNEELNEYPSADVEDQVDATLTPQKRPIPDVIFFNETYFRINGYLKKLSEMDIRYFGARGSSDSGYDLTRGPGVVLTVGVDQEGFSEEVYILCPKPAQQAQPTNPTGYQSVNQGLASLDIEIGKWLTATGDLYRRLKTAPPGWPAGYYLVAEIGAVKQLESATAK